MKYEKAFGEYLRTRYKSSRTGGQLSPKVVSDILSRCRTAERLMNLELTKSWVVRDEKFDELTLRLKQALYELPSRGKMRYPHHPYMHSINIYRRFVSETED